jgi:hypothetical protein
MSQESLQQAEPPACGLPAKIPHVAEMPQAPKPRVFDQQFSDLGFHQILPPAGKVAI